MPFSPAEDKRPEAAIFAGCLATGGVPSFFGYDTALQAQSLVVVGHEDQDQKHPKAGGDDLLTAG